MGCGASKEVIDLTAVNAGMTSGYGMVNTGRIGCLMKQKFFSMSGDDFAIRDHLGEVLFNVKGNALSVREKMHITDKAGAKIAVMQKKLMALRSTFYMYTYKPNFEGQEPTEKDTDGEALYRYAFLEDQVASVLGRHIVKKYVTSNEEVAAVGAFEIFVQFSILKFTCRIKTYITPEDKKAGAEQTVIATFGETSFWQWEGASLIGVEMAVGLRVTRDSGTVGTVAPPTPRLGPPE